MYTLLVKIRNTAIRRSAINRLTFGIVALLLLTTTGLLQAAEMRRSGFFDFYHNLQPVDASWISFMYTSDQLEEVLSTTRAIVVPQPEIFLATNSKYKGISPAEMNALANAFRSIVIDALADKYQITERPGENTIVLRMALSNMYLKKKGRGLMGYTPIGFVVTTAKRQMQDFAEKILLTEITWEAEILDGRNADVLAQLMVPMGNNSSKKEFTSWDDLVTAMSVGGLRLRCRLDNAAAGTARDCLEITEADLPEH